MASRELTFDAEARRQLKIGIDALANAVKVTLGPRGRNVAMDKKWGAPTVTHDGVTVAKEIELENHFQNMGAQMLKQAATKTNDVAGDGTTTSTVIAQAIVTEGLRSLAAGANPMLMKRGIDAATAAVVVDIKRVSTELKGHDDIERIASISANDPEIGRLLAEVMDKVGRDGVITVEEGKGLKLEVEYTEGMQFDRGYISPYFVTDSGRMEVVLDEPYLLITDKKISAITDIVPVLEKLVQAGHKELVIIAEDVDGEALATLVVNKLRGILNVLAVKAPGFGDRRGDMLRDIATATGGHVVATSRSAATYQELRNKHTLLAKDLASSDLGPDYEQPIRDFLREVVSAGTFLKDPDDRAHVLDIHAFWSAVLRRASGRTVYAPLSESASSDDHTPHTVASLGYDNLKLLTLNDLGRARRVVSTKDDTTIVESRGSRQDIQARINQIKIQIDETTSDYDREKLQERLAKLSGDVAVIKVGAVTEVELKMKKARVEDALHATHAAVEEGVIPGGGVTLLRAAKAVDALTLEGDQKVGAEILRRALEEPVRQLVRNAGLEGSVVVEHLSREQRSNWGFDVMSEDYVDLVEKGIIDPAKVTRSALENAASVAGMILTSEALVTQLPAKPPPPLQAGGPDLHY